MKKTEVSFYVDTYEAVNNEPPISEIVAVFNDEWMLQNDELVFDCYTHFGQHSTCSQSFLAESCRKAKKNEYLDLCNELKNSVGYNLKIK